ncbi:YeiH family protein [Petropleomorpha daqingensis]|uniref:Putative integral membrane protein (TIGR00698 family) n=1 Tax=Petropleomorpha daqingensis TaxID=2026353 RepID=A0A853CIE2_9ACTN|nr:putative sulfate exporter family transporter [Petropleomorpha daqingensis]NYJ07570.1 putative integral membrane protein (TIGR00698 family) [Petropleomorpha daqingensis]
MTASSVDPAVRGAAAPPPADAPSTPTRRWPGLLAAALGLGGALLAHRFVPAIGVLTWAVFLGMVAGNTRLLPAAARQALGKLTKRLLRIGIVLLGFSVSFASIAALGIGTIALVAGSLVATLVVTTWLGNRLRLGRARSLIIGTGFAICGASAIAAMEDTARADDEDVTVGIAMVTLFGTIAMVALPLLWHPLGLSDAQFGIWAGASIQEVGQVVAAAGAGGAAVVAIAVVAKLTRVVLLAPVVAAVSVRRRLAEPGGGADGEAGAKRPPIVPLFVLGFVACAALRSTGIVPEGVLGAISQVQVAALGAALFGMGAGVRLASLFRGSSRVLAVATFATVFIAGLSLAGVLLLGS